ncbi:MAG: hypothetical protein A2Z34_03195 [Planctomycetes bacterium RBG_16_59_8]|nr:MAG: hypothetical protein A2Z34_03195 [Planctomycetes bacterium RBG_16_59_8]
MRTFEKTHPWISFKVDLRSAPTRLWLRLGEAASKCEHIASVPLRPSTAAMLHQLYLAKGVMATTAIEGNTLTEKEVLQHLDGTLRLPPSKRYLAQEIDNIVNACNLIAKRLHSGDDSMPQEQILEFNRLVLEKLSLGDDVFPGKLRAHSVVVGNVYRGAPAEDCPHLMERLCAWLSGPDFQAPAGMELVYAIIKAVAAHLYLAWIHPFGDGNGRTARLMEFQILLAAGVPTPAAHLMSNHYNQTRSEYYRQLVQSSATGGNIIPFLEYAVQGFVDGLREQLQMIRDQQWDVAWQNYVHERFQDKTSPSHIRRRHLALDLSGQAEPIQPGKIMELTPRIARAYARKTTKTLQRDLNALATMGLVEKSSKGVRARREIILAFLPWRKQSKEKKEVE